MKSKKMTKKAQDGDSKPVSIITEFWGEKAARHGWTAIPNSLLMLQNELDLNPTEFCILLNILMHQWPSDGRSVSFPAIITIASRIGVTKRTVQRGILELEKKGVLLKEQTNRNNIITKGKNIFDTSNLKSILNEKSEGLNKKTKTVAVNNEVSQVCLFCGTIAKSKKTIGSVFGYRETLAGKISNSICKMCRNENTKNIDIF